MHFHRDMLAICDSYARHVLRAEPTDRFIGSPPLAFTFGLGGLVLFPLRIGASTVLLEKAAPDELLAAIAKYRRHRLLHRADRLSRHARQARRARHLVAAQMRVGRRDAAEGRPSRPGTRRPASRSSTASARPRCCTSSSARPRTRSAPAPPASAVPGYEAMRDRRRGQARCRPAPSAGSRCAARPAAAISPTAASPTTCRTAGTSPATPT